MFFRFGLFLSVYIFFWFLCILFPLYYGIGATIRIGREIRCLLYAGFLFYLLFFCNKLLYFLAFIFLYSFQFVIWILWEWETNYSFSNLIFLSESRLKFQFNIFQSTHNKEKRVTYDIQNLILAYNDIIRDAESLGRCW